MTGYIARLREQDEANRRAVVANRWLVLQLAGLRVQRRITVPGKAHPRLFEQQRIVAEQMLAMLPRDEPRVISARVRALVDEVDRTTEHRRRQLARSRVA